MPPIKFLKSDTDENEAKNAQIQAAYSSYADTSTWHGIPDLFVAKSRFVKIFWVLVLLSSCGMLIYQMYNVIDDYSQEPHYSTSLVAVVLPNGVPFPNVTVCNLIRASKSKLFKINMTTSALSFLYASLAQYYKTSSYLLDSKTNISILSHIKTEFNKFASQFDETSSDPAKIFDYIGHDCNDTLIKCWWTGIDFDCCQYSKAILTAYGKCYSITPPAGAPYLAGNPPTENIPGPGNGLSLWLDPRMSDSTRTLYNDFLADGMMIIIDSEPAFWPIEPIMLEPKSNSFISLSSEFSYYSQPKIKVFPIPCRTDALFQHITGEYTIPKCVMDCYMVVVTKYCGCVFVLGSVGNPLRNDHNFKFCKIVDATCYIQILYGKEGWSVGAFNDYLNCTNFCFPPCRSLLSYKAVASRTTTTNETIQLMQELGVRDADSMIQVEVFYPFIGYTEKATAEKLSIFDLIGNLGGQMGVWAGMSIISWIQVV